MDSVQNLNDFSVYLMDPNKTELHGTNLEEMNLVWNVGQVKLTVWMAGSFEIPQGEYLVLFEVNGNSVTASIDDILLVPGECGNLSEYFGNLLYLKLYHHQ